MKRNFFKNLSFLVFISSILLQFSCNKTTIIENAPPICTIVNPENNTEIQHGETVMISVEATDTDGSIVEVRFYINEKDVGASSSHPYDYEWNTIGETVGTYTIKTKAKDNKGRVTADEINLKLVDDSINENQPIANFIANQIYTSPDSLVQFTGLSSNAPDTWFWDFGDGETSFSQNPSHIYSTSGAYTISLTVTNGYGTDTESKSDYINVMSGSGESDMLTDYDGNTYSTIKIGNQWWMAENLKVTHYTDGTEILLEENSTDWNNLGYLGNALCYYDNSALNKSLYGTLYTWVAAMNGESSSDTKPSGVQGVCPTNWHLPSEQEWLELTDFMGGADIAGGKMKTSGTMAWSSPNAGATNENGFTALPAGHRSFYGTFYRLGINTDYWSTSEANASEARYIFLSHLNSVVFYEENYKNYGFSIRCVKD